MPYEWDSSNVDHIALRDVAAAEAEQVLENEPIELQKTERNGEKRIIHLGETDVGRVLVVAITLRCVRVRVVTAYPANRKLRAFYQSQKAGSDERHTEDS